MRETAAKKSASQIPTQKTPLAFFVSDHSRQQTADSRQQTAVSSQQSAVSSQQSIINIF
jgi:hypothetical protein